MVSSLAILGTAIVVFVSTNIDDLFVLLVFFSDTGVRLRNIVIGQFAGIAALLAISWAASRLSVVIPSTYIGLLGIAPIAIGFHKLLEFRHKSEAGEELKTHREAGVNGQLIFIALTTVANGGDNIGVYTPLFAVLTAKELAETALVFAIMTALWCYFAHFMVNRPRLGAPIRKWGRLLAPLVLIGLGALILLRTGAVAAMYHFARKGLE